jgi:uncharacterized protein YggU (UPF0235/DUF167 family)
VKPAGAGASADEALLPYRVAGGCVIVRVRLTPRSSLDAVGEITPTAEGPALAVRVRAVPSDGAANDALQRLMARWLDLPASCVRVTGGGKSRVKSLTIDGDADRVAARIRERLKPAAA